MVSIFSRHFNAHSLIPDNTGTFRSPEVIYQECATEMYAWCRAHDFYKLWAYLFVNWYTFDMWKLWARSVCPCEIPVLRTTMIVESHWRRIKGDFLQQLNRPRIDLVIWVLITRSIPQGLDKMRTIKEGNYRKAVASWRKEFKQQWKSLASSEVDIRSLQRYHTDAVSWTCGCESFLLSRFLLCKHIVPCFSDLQDPIRFFNSVQRQRSRPFWIHPQLVLRPQFMPSTTYFSESLVGETSQQMMLDVGTNNDSDNLLEEDHLVNLDEDATETYDSLALASELRRLADLITEQHSIGNNRFAQSLSKQSVRLLSVLDDIDRDKRRHTSAPTWAGNYKNPSAMFYKHLKN